MADYLEIEESFWGVCLENGKKYSQTVDKSVHISMAAIEPSSKGSKEPTSLWCEKEGISYLICSLGASTFQQHLDLNFNEGETVTLYTKGQGTIHLTGYLHLDTDFASDDDDEYMNGEGGEEEDNLVDDECEEEEEDLKEVIEPKIMAVKKRKLEQKGSSKSKKSKIDSDDDDGDDDDGDKEIDDDEEDEEEEKTTPVKSTPKKEAVKIEKTDGEGEKKKKKKKKKKNKEGVKEDKTQEATSSKPTKGESKRKVGEGGVVIENVKEGHGPEAVVGKNVKVYYTGKLESGKIFDAKTSGSPFNFKLGRKEVIAGWDAGVKGMKVGGKRKLTIPAKMAYGSQKLTGIPPNSTLIFDVELKAVK